MATTTQGEHTLIGIFRTLAEARTAVRRLDDRGIAPAHVEVVADDRAQAADLGGRSFAVWGAFGGFVLGLLLIALYVIAWEADGRDGALDVPALVIGGGGMSIGLGFIGFVFGRALVARSARWRDYEKVVDDGGALVTVTCESDECDRARDVLTRAGAAEIDDEAFAEHV